MVKVSVPLDSMNSSTYIPYKGRVVEPWMEPVQVTVRSGYEGIRSILRKDPSKLDNVDIPGSRFGVEANFLGNVQSVLNGFELSLQSYNPMPVSEIEKLLSGVQEYMNGGIVTIKENGPGSREILLNDNTVEYVMQTRARPEITFLIGTDGYNFRAVLSEFFLENRIDKILKDPKETDVYRTKKAEGEPYASLSSLPHIQERFPGFPLRYNSGFFVRVKGANVGPDEINNLGRRLLEALADINHEMCVYRVDKIVISNVVDMD